MKIALLAPAPAPYARGAAERLWWGLARHLNEHTRHQAELLKLPCPRDDVRGIVRAYQAFDELDLGGFDLVVSGQHAAWMARHPRHVVYFVDALPSAQGDVEAAAAANVVTAHPGLASLLAYMRRYRGAPSALPEFFARWNELAAPGSAPEEAFAGAGLVARAALRWLDEIALCAARISRHVAISASAGRSGLFPAGVAPTLARPPADASVVPGNRFDHFLVPEGADARPVADAMRQVRTSRELVIASRREDLAPDELLRDALALVVASDGGEAQLRAIEAAAFARPAILEPDPASLARAMQRLADDPEAARVEGLAAREETLRARWADVEAALLAEPARAAPRSRARRKLLLASTFGIHPPRHGGQSRIYHFYRALAPEFETVIVSVRSAVEPAFEGEIAPGVREVRVPLSAEHEQRAAEQAQAMGASVIDVTMPALHALSPELERALRREAEGACAAIASHPYLLPALAKLGLPLWYEAHNLETDLKRALFADRPGGERLVAEVEAVERAAAQDARVILCSSPDDARALVERFGADAGRILDVPNGTDAARIGFIEGAGRLRLRARMGLEGSPPVALFMGSGHWPNVQAARHVLEFAAALPHVAFVVMGSVGYHFDPRATPPNVLFLGEVDDVARNLCLQACDVALNPMEQGSGTNLKMLDFFAAGLPAISSERGARGLRLEGERECLVRAIEEFPAAIDDVIELRRDQAQERARRARALVEREFDWAAIARRVMPRLLEAAS